MPDPFAELSPFRHFLDLGLPRAGTAQFPPLPEEEAAPLKERLLHAPVSGLHWLGGTLDKAFGGRAIRGLLGGRPAEALSAIPFSDTIGITDPADAVTGQELLNRWGYHPERGNWAERNLAGPAAEIALDPGTYLSLGGKGAATALGKVLQGGGHVPGWTHRALIEGFQHTAPGLRAAGLGEEAIAHLGRTGVRIAGDEAVGAARAAGFAGDLAGAPLSGLAGVGLPFLDTAGSVGHGPVSRAIAGGFDAAKDLAKYAPGVRQLRAAFATPAGRVSHAGAQRAYEAGAVPAREAVDAATRLEEHDLRTQFDAIMEGVADLPGAEPEAQKVIRGLAEGAPQYRDPARWAADFARRHGRGITPGVTDPAAVAAAIDAQYPALRAIAGRVAAHGRSIYEEARRTGLPLEELGDDWTDYVLRRYIAATPGFQGKEASKFLPVQSGSNLHRAQSLKDIPGGTEQLNEWAMDRGLVGPGRLADDAARKSQIYADLERNALLASPTGALDAGTIRSLQGKASSIDTWLRTVPEGHATGTVPYFSPDVIGDLVSRGHRHARTMGAARALYEGIGGMARPIGEFANAGERVPLHEFLLRTLRRTNDLPAPLTADHEAAVATAGFRDLDHARGVARVVQATPAGVAPAVTHADLAAYQALGPLGDRLTREVNAPLVEAYKALARRGVGDVAEVYDGAVRPEDVLKGWALPARDAQVLSGMLNNWVTPAEASPFLSWMRSAQNFFKNAVYPTWPASHVRNATSIWWNNFLHGTGLGDYADALRVMKGGRVRTPDAYAATRGMTPEEAAATLRRLAYGHGKVFGGIGSFEERVGARGLDDELLQAGLSGSRRLTPHAPGMTPHPSIREMAAMPGAFDPLHQQGVGGGPIHRAINAAFRGGKEALPYAEDRFLPLRMGRAAGTKIEDFGRFASYLGNLRRGMSPEEAGKLTRAIHFDYSDLTQAEQSLFKNVIPFYTFLRKNLPYQVQMAFERPSAVSPLLHGLGDASGRGWMPEYLASGTAIPLGDEGEGGSRRYLTGLGLPIEEALARLKFRDVELPGIGTRNLPAVGPTAMAFAASLNPLIKAPIEQVLDTQFHTGRKLSDLSTAGPASLWGQIPDEYARPLGQLLANSPLARVSTAARTLTDPRKTWLDAAINLGTGFRVSDVDMGKLRAVAARNELDRLLAADPRLAQFTNFYPRPGPEGAPAPPPPPALVERLRLFTGMKLDARAYHEAEARRRAAGPP